MSNPNNAIGTNAAYGGRTSVNAFNDDLAAFSRGVLSGWGCTPNTGLTVSVGGDGNNRDVAIAEDNIGDRTTINNISGSPVNVTLAAAPGANSRIDAIVAYVDNPPQGSSTVADNPSACGIIAVSGTAASSPVAPTESAIRSAITADGASGTTAYFVVLAYVTMASGTTDIVADNITAGPAAKVSSNNVDLTAIETAGSYSDSEADTGFTWIDGSKIYKKTISSSAGLTAGSSLAISHGISNLGIVIKHEGTFVASAGSYPLPFGAPTSQQFGGNAAMIWLTNDSTTRIYSNYTLAGTAYVTLYYTKTS